MRELDHSAHETTAGTTSGVGDGADIPPDPPLVGQLRLSMTDTAETWRALDGMGRRLYPYLMVWSILPGLALTAYGVFDLRAWVLPGPLIFAGAIVTGAPLLSALRIRGLPPATRQQMVTVDAEGVRLQDASGLDLRVPWRGFLGVMESDGYFFAVLPGTRALTFPRRAWPTPAAWDAALRLVRAHLEPYTPPSRIATIIAWALANMLATLNVMARLLQ